MANRNSGEPPKEKGGNGIDTSNLIGVRSALKDTQYEKALAPDTNGYNTPSYNSAKPQKGEEKMMGQTEAIEFVQRVAGVDAETAKEMNDAIWMWSNGAYYGIRKFQQGKNNNPNYEKYAKNIEKYIERAAKWNGGVTYRGIDVNNTGFNVGDKIDMQGTSSWSTHESVAQSFAMSYGSVFVSRTQSHGTSINFSHQHHGEHEVAVSQKASYIIDRIEKKGSRTYYYVHEG